MDKDELQQDLEGLKSEMAKALRAQGAHEPDWDPLEKTIPYEWCGSFMFMGYSGAIRLYKHGLTRRYLNIDPEGRTYGYAGNGRYFEIPVEAAIEACYERLEEMGYTRDGDHQAMREDRYRRIKETGWTTVRLGPGDD